MKNNNTLLIIVSIIAVIAIIAFFMKNSGYKYPVDGKKYRKIKMQNGNMDCFNFIPSNAEGDYGISITEANATLCS